MTKIRTEILIETNESLKIKRKRHSVRAFCDVCRRVSIMVSPMEAAFLACRDIDSIVCLMYENRLHVRYLGKKNLFVCLTSLCLHPFEYSETVFREEIETVAEITNFLQSNNFDFVKEK